MFYGVLNEYYNNRLSVSDNIRKIIIRIEKEIEYTKKTMSNCEISSYKHKYWMILKDYEFLLSKAKTRVESEDIYDYNELYESCNEIGRRKMEITKSCNAELRKMRRK